MTDLTIEELENWLDSFNGITPMAKHSKENQTNAGQIVAQLLATMKREEKMREALEDIYHHAHLPFIGQLWLNYAKDVAFKALKPCEYRDTKNNSK